MSNVYYIDQTFVDGLISDPSPLVECDDARFDALASPPGFELQDADPGELLYELGLRDGDIPLTLNSMSLVTYGNAFDAFALLYLTQAETSLKLEVKRGAHTLTFEYELQ